MIYNFRLLEIVIILGYQLTPFVNQIYACIKLKAHSSINKLLEAYINEWIKIY